MKQFQLMKKKKQKKKTKQNNFFNNSKPRMMTLYFSKKVSAILSRITWKTMVVFNVWIALIHLQQQKN